MQRMRMQHQRDRRRAAAVVVIAALDAPFRAVDDHVRHVDLGSIPTQELWYKNSDKGVSGCREASLHRCESIAGAVPVQAQSRRPPYRVSFGPALLSP